MVGLSLRHHKNGLKTPWSEGQVVEENVPKRAEIIQVGEL